jgi:hypothetical protein
MLAADELGDLETGRNRPGTPTIRHHAGNAAAHVRDVRDLAGAVSLKTGARSELLAVNFFLSSTSLAFPLRLLILKNLFPERDNIDHPHHFRHQHRVVELS